MFDWPLLGQHLLTMGTAALLGGVIGLERELKGHWAGLRTHIMVSMGAAIFILVGVPQTTSSPAELSRVIQGVATGIGFIGAGTIIKLTARMEVKGLTTASTIWMAAAVGVAVGVRMYLLAICSAVLSVIVLRGLRFTERSVRQLSNTVQDHMDDDSDKAD